jgi:hypothetical protein
MKPTNIKILHRRISALTTEQLRLEQELDKTLMRHSKAVGFERGTSLREYLTASEAVRQTQRRVHIAKRLLARAQGDEYEFRVP